MKKTLLVSIRLVALFALLGAFALAGCENGDGGTKVPFLVSITIEGAPETYAAGADLNVGGLTVTLTYSNGVASSVTLPEGTVGVLDEAGDLTYTVGGITIIISGYNPDETGDQTITVTVGSKTEEYTITLSSTTTDKAAFNTAIAAANTAKAGVVVDTDAANVAIGTEWVTQEVLAAFNTAIATAEGVATDSEASADQITSAVTALNAAIAAFNGAKQDGTGTDIVNANKAELNTAIAGANTAKTGVVVDSAAANVATGTKWVTQGALSTFNAAISAAEGVSSKNGATQAEVDSAVTTLNSAKDTFNAAKQDGTKANEVSVDKPALTTAITTANSAKSGVVVDTAAANVATGTKWVTQGAWDALATAITNAETVSANNGATQAQVSSAVTALSTAVTTFNNAKKDGAKTGGVTINKTALNTAITTANSAKSGVVVDTAAANVATGTKWVTQGALDTFTTAIATADGVAANNSATQAVVDNAVTTLNAAKDTFNDAKKDGAKADVSIAIYTFTFNTGEGGSAIAAQTVSAGGTVTRPANPTKDGVNFDDWYTTEGLTVKYDFTAAVNSNTTVYAKWITAADAEADAAKKELAEAKATLAGKITEALALNSSINIPENTAYQTAITSAQWVHTNGSTKEQVTEAIAALQTATGTFTTAKDAADLVTALVQLQTAITAATTAKNAAVITTDFAEGTKYAAGGIFQGGSAAAIPVGLKVLAGTDPRTAYETAISTAQSAYDNPTTAAAANSAKGTLDGASGTFISALAAAKTDATSGTKGLLARVTAATTGTTIYLYGNEGVAGEAATGSISNKAIILEGVGEERTITLESNGRMFQIGTSGSLTLNDNVTLKGKASNTKELVYLGSTAEFIMNTGSKLTGNVNSSTYGGGVVNTGVFKLSGGEISGNKATYGGSVYVSSSGTFNQSGGTISDNTATTNNGGGVYVNGGTFNQSGGAISGNEATSYGGGMYVTGKFNLSASGVISGNKAGTSGGGVYFTGNSSEFNQTGGTIGGDTEAKGNKATTNGGGVYLAAGTFKLSGSSAISNNTGTNGGGVYVSGANSKFTQSGGTISSNKATNDGGGVYAAENDTFDQSGGTIGGDTAAKGNKATNDGGGVYIYKGKFNQSGGLISGNKATNGGGVYMYHTGSSPYPTFNLSGNGEISGNTATDGGGVYVLGGSLATFNQTGGAIKNNAATNGGGGVYLSGQTPFNLSSSGVISGNTASGGGGVYVFNGIFTQSGGTISSNIASTIGGGVYVNQSSGNARFFMSEGTITANNSAPSGYGNALYKNATGWAYFGASTGSPKEDDYIIAGGGAGGLDGLITGHPATAD
ncbi:beta strand repeat-containing protein [Treponema primitia]|nr:InlB B-repeat-containing protein [Treponema primitia]